MFASLLIANRGEIARRVMRTAARLGLRTIAVYSDADAEALHVREADKAVRIGPAPARESYLRVDAILEAAAKTGAEAIHPGYGFLSEKAEFAEACAKAGLVFVGPDAASIRAMGLKDEAKRLMEAAGVPVTPGYHGADQSEVALKAAAKEIGFPVLIKAVAGGGGKGMRKVEKASDLAAALASARREAQNAFGDDRVLIEKYVTGPRHIEVQVFGDRHGGAIHLFERDCSVQRRHQKVLEEAPAPGMSEAMRAAMTAAAVKAAKAVDYVNAGTVEFIADGSGPLRPDGFWFMEMNTRLQVEHPVTEMVTGLDLVELQLRVAAGEKLPKQSEITLTGHAIEARLYAEDPANGFLPSTGRLARAHLGEGGAEMRRVDAAVQQGSVVTPHYDPMIAKLIAWAETRQEALERLAEHAGDVEVYGVATNAAFLKRCLEHPEFRAGGVDTHFLTRALDALIAPDAAAARAALLFGAAMWLGIAPPGPGQGEPAVLDPWEARDGFRINATPALRIRCALGGAIHGVAFTREGVGWSADVAGERHRVADLSVWRALGAGAVEGCIEGRVDGRPWELAFLDINDALIFFHDGAAYAVTPPHPEAAAEALEGGDEIAAPMPGKVIAVSAKAGDAVVKGQPLLVLEAMKMEHALPAPRDGVIAELRAATGTQVKGGDVLVRLEPEG